MDGSSYQAHMRQQSGAPLDLMPGEKFHYDNSGYLLRS